MLQTRISWQFLGHRSHIVVLTSAPPADPPKGWGTSPTWAAATQAAGPQGKGKENLSLKYSQGFQQAPLHPPTKVLLSLRT